MPQEQPLVGILMGSDNDYDVMVEAARALKGFAIPFEMTVASAHRSPARTARYVHEAAPRGIRVIIAGAGAAAHLAGVIAAETTLPVIGVPIDASSLNGLDALLAMVQMPAGIPVATMAIGKAGARNAGVLAAQILALSDPELAQRLQGHKSDLAAGVEQRAEALAARLRSEKW
ncbi:MAG: 5-(carboxyamino)imidazole ribonucleotide mutase [Desulfuromonadales bacterium GWD2_61_12]|nr:MAG: 5-(carboxyamino)imidazole ribonucleotide mutase [Desulfuromonadales bacterium GWC2_61_20]OGR36419.1 MAG: 5-(carboxyamino)imidazole ribonucleotide mutase [Desulfuromonadales bacterium GWD2_61_12]HAD05273.1 5-(carboxyamino)imidazole ribonucleotide mutase [Desulfuromonas sp.]HBT83816.1 5-(carboxyamino)imidazole ribonucleotide mutase [Desulfuromonas sp.]